MTLQMTSLRGGCGNYSQIGLFLSFKRTRPKAVNEPESCIYGVHAPEKIHLLINQTSDAFRMS